MNSEENGSGLPLVSIIVPVYNVERYLRECMDSLLNQTLQDIEVICVDDGSTDSSAAIMKDYAVHDGRIVILTKENGGLSSARNAGIAMARGEYLYFMDSDDYIDLDAMAHLYHEASKGGLDVLYFDGDAFFENEELQGTHGQYGKYYQRKMEYGKPQRGANLFAEMRKNGDYRPSVCLQFIKRDYLARIGLKFIEGILYEDNPFSLQCILQAGRTRHIFKAFFHRRVRPESITTQKAGLRNYEGRYTCVVKMLEFISGHIQEEVVVEQVIEEVRAIFHNVAGTYLELSEDDKSAADALIVGEQYFSGVAPKFPGRLAWTLALASNGHRISARRLQARLTERIEKLTRQQDEAKKKGVELAQRLGQRRRQRDEYKALVRQLKDGSNGGGRKGAIREFALVADRSPAPGAGKMARRPLMRRGCHALSPADVIILCRRCNSLVLRNSGLEKTGKSPTIREEK